MDVFHILQSSFAWFKIQREIKEVRKNKNMNFKMNMKAQVSVSMLENGYFRRHLKIANNILVNSVKYLY